jgi:hypothetical protein
MGESGGKEEEQREGGGPRLHGAIVASEGFGVVMPQSRSAKIAETIRSVWKQAAVKIKEWLLLFQFLLQ